MMMHLAFGWRVDLQKCNDLSVVHVFGAAYFQVATAHQILFFFQSSIAEPVCDEYVFNFGTLLSQVLVPSVDWMVHNLHKNIFQVLEDNSQVTTCPPSVAVEHCAGLTVPQ